MYFPKLAWSIEAVGSTSPQRGMASGLTILEPLSLWQKAGRLMEPLRQEVHEFSRASEKLLGYEVKLEDLTVMEREVIHYYLSAIGEKFPTHQLKADEGTTRSLTTS